MGAIPSSLFNKTHKVFPGQISSLVPMCAELGYSMRDIAKMYEAFMSMDRTCKGFLSITTFAASQQSLTPEFGEMLGLHFDANKDNSIDFEEFLIGTWNSLSLKECDSPLLLFQILDVGRVFELKLSIIREYVDSIWTLNADLREEILSDFQIIGEGVDLKVTRRCFCEICWHYPILLSPIYKMRERMMNTTLGKKRWQQISSSRNSKYCNSDLIDIIKMMEYQPRSYANIMIRAYAIDCSLTELSMKKSKSSKKSSGLSYTNDTNKTCEKNDKFSPNSSFKSTASYDETPQGPYTYNQNPYHNSLDNGNTETQLPFVTETVILNPCDSCPMISVSAISVNSSPLSDYNHIQERRNLFSEIHNNAGDQTPMTSMGSFMLDVQIDQNKIQPKDISKSIMRTISPTKLEISGMIKRAVRRLSSNILSRSSFNSLDDKNTIPLHNIKEKKQKMKFEIFDNDDYKNNDRTYMNSSTNSMNRLKIKREISSKSWINSADTSSDFVDTKLRHISHKHSVESSGFFLKESSSYRGKGDSKIFEDNIFVISDEDPDVRLSRRASRDLNFLAATNSISLNTLIGHGNILPGHGHNTPGNGKHGRIVPESRGNSVKLTPLMSSDTSIRFLAKKYTIPEDLAF